ncbi:MAG TPA: ABC transporter ATP-binding protein [Clostridiales bacterium]|nr:ABC transporter ATP-binding protein [Clostridiales bacterium]
MNSFQSSQKNIISGCNNNNRNDTNNGNLESTNRCNPGAIKLEVKNVKKSFDKLPVIDEVSLYMREKEFVSILGLSGSGKSTIFNIISGLLIPDEGEIIIDGKNYTGKIGRVSYMYQKDLLLQWKKIIDNVALPLVIKGEGKKTAREKVRDYFKEFGLEGFEYMYPSQLSGGMRQRTAFLRTYMFSRDIMLLDEPFGGLDAITRSKIHYWIMDVLDKLDTAVMFITHDIEEAVFLSDRIYILSDKPAKVMEEVIIDLPRPRNKEIITTGRFNDFKRHILKIMDSISRN